MASMNEKVGVGKPRSGQVIEMTPNFGCRILKQVEDRIIYAFAWKRRGIKSLAAEHGCKQGEIEEIVRERILGQKAAA